MDFRSSSTTCPEGKIQCITHKGHQKTCSFPQMEGPDREEILQSFLWMKWGEGGRGQDGNKGPTLRLIKDPVHTCTCPNLQARSKADSPLLFVLHELQPLSSSTSAYKCKESFFMRIKGLYMYVKCLLPNKPQEQQA